MKRRAERGAIFALVLVAVTVLMILSTAIFRTALSLTHIGQDGVVSFARRERAVETIVQSREVAPSFRTLSCRRSDHLTACSLHRGKRDTVPIIDLEQFPPLPCPVPLSPPQESLMLRSSLVSSDDCAALPVSSGSFRVPHNLALSSLVSTRAPLLAVSHGYLTVTLLTATSPIHLIAAGDLRIGHLQLSSAARLCLLSLSGSVVVDSVSGKGEVCAVGKLGALLPAGHGTTGCECITSLPTLSVVVAAASSE